MNEPASLRGDKSFELVKQNCCSKDDEARATLQVYQWQFTVATQLHQWKEYCRVRRSIQILSTVKLLCVISSVGRVSALQAECHRFETDMALYKAKVGPIIVSGFDSHHQDFLMRWNGDTRDLKSCTYNRPILCEYGISDSALVYGTSLGGFDSCYSQNILESGQAGNAAPC